MEICVYTTIAIYFMMFTHRPNYPGNSHDEIVYRLFRIFTYIFIVSIVIANILALISRP